GLLAVELGEELFDEQREFFGVVGPLGGLDTFDVAVLGTIEYVAGLLDDPAALASHAATAYVEDLDGNLEVVARERHEVGVGAVAEHDGLLLECLAQRPEIVTQARCGLEIEFLRGGL